MGGLIITRWLSVAGVLDTSRQGGLAQAAHGCGRASLTAKGAAVAAPLCSLLDWWMQPLEDPWLQPTLFLARLGPSWLWPCEPAFVM